MNILYNPFLSFVYFSHSLICTHSHDFSNIRIIAKLANHFKLSLNISLQCQVGDPPST